MSKPPIIVAVLTGTLIWGLVTAGHYAVAAGTGTFAVLLGVFEIYEQLARSRGETC